MKQYRIGIIGLGNMGSGYVQALLSNPRWQIAAACDIGEARLAWIKDLIPGVRTTTNAQEIIDDPTIDVVGIFTLSDIRAGLIRSALAKNKHVMAEKPIASGVATEQALLADIEASDRIVAVNLFNRNAWYHHEMQDFIRQGEIGQLAVIRVSHQSPGLMPTDGHQPEGPPFHDCGMHYVDVARWYAGSEYGSWHAQGMRMWNWEDPWWVSAQGSFKNGVVFNIVQGFVYGQRAETKVVNCGLEAIGTMGVVRMQHDFETVTLDFHGVNRTVRKQGPYGGKKLDVMIERFADSLDAGRPMGIPTARDSVIASEVSQAMLDYASANAAPAIGNAGEMQDILDYRKLRSQKPMLPTAPLIEPECAPC